MSSVDRKHARGLPNALTNSTGCGESCSYYSSDLYVCLCVPGSNQRDTLQQLWVENQPFLYTVQRQEGLTIQSSFMTDSCSQASP